MRDLTSKIVLAHKGYFDREGRKHYRENSRELCAVTTQKDYIGIIELDVRKSKDGIPYCYHGSTWEYFVALKFRRNFSELREKYHVDTLKEILEVITEDKRVLLDIKDRAVTKEDILSSIGDKKFQEVILGGISTSFLKRFDGMPKEFVKVFFGNIFCNFYSLERLRKENFRYFDVVFPFQISAELVKKTRGLGMEFGCFSLFFRSQKSYWEKVNRYGIRRISSDFI